MTMAKKLPLLAPSIHTFEVNGTYTDCEAKRTVFMAIQKMVSAGKYYRIPYHGSSKKGYSYKRKDGGLTITLADYGSQNFVAAAVLPTAFSTGVN